MVEQGEAFYEAAAEQRLEGIVAKRAESRYTGGRTREWLKIKCHLRQEFVDRRLDRAAGRARLVRRAAPRRLRRRDRLVYVAKVGTGFDEATLRRCWDRLQPLEARDVAVRRRHADGRGHHWVEPTLVAEVRFTEWTEEGGIRHPAFLGLRADKSPQECRRETGAGSLRRNAFAREPAPGPAARPARGCPRPRARAARSRRERGRFVDRRVVVTNPTKVFWPDEGYTKSRSRRRTTRASRRWLLPYLRDRPVVLTRYPDGIKGKSFFQKDAPTWVPSWVHTERIRAEGVERDIDYFIVDDVETLRYVANTGTIPLHLWASRLSALDRPDWLVLDLDPKGAPFTDVVKIALAIRQHPRASWSCRATRRRRARPGLHILLPLAARYSYEETRTFARLLATLAVEALPAIATIARMIRTRGGKVYVDFGQNGRGQTIVAPFSVRPLPGAPVSWPLRWSEVTATPRSAALHHPDGARAAGEGRAIRMAPAARRGDRHRGRARPAGRAHVERRPAARPWYLRGHDAAVPPEVRGRADGRDVRRPLAGSRPDRAGCARHAARHPGQASSPAAVRWTSPRSETTPPSRSWTSAI